MDCGRSRTVARRRCRPSDAPRCTRAARPRVLGLGSSSCALHVVVAARRGTGDRVRHRMEHRGVDDRATRRAGPDRGGPAFRDFDDASPRYAFSRRARGGDRGDGRGARCGVEGGERRVVDPPGVRLARGVTTRYRSVARRIRRHHDRRLAIRQLPGPLPGLRRLAHPRLLPRRRVGAVGVVRSRFHHVDRRRVRATPRVFARRDMRPLCGAVCAPCRTRALVPSRA